MIIIFVNNLRQPEKNFLSSNTKSKYGAKNHLLYEAPLDMFIMLPEHRFFWWFPLREDHKINDVIIWYELE